MEKINDLNIYLQRMDKTLFDKCWWIDKIPEEIDTIVDFGCATGNLYHMVSLLTGNKYKYIGIDDSAEMRANFNADGEVYASLEEALPHFNPSSSVLILNSVLHEIFSYITNPESFIEKIINIKFQYIAIRDMCISRKPFLDFIFYSHYDNIIKSSNWCKQWLEFSSHSQHLDGPNLMKEFLLKYWYSENWERECKEKYLHPWENYFINNPNYQVEFENEFYIPYVRNRIHKDFGFWYDEPTHKKMLLHLIKN